MKAQDFFEQYPDRDVCYETTDGNLFFLHCDAVNHSKTLKDANVVKHERGDQQLVENSQPPVDDDNSQQTEKKAKVKKTKK
ncbi:MAG: hypothetical protein LC105_04230 [Chitinophagales bacterium]|nr:hypothetical protein [Chitinophagales bacterium]